MAQFDVFPNPVLRARDAYPFVVSLQSPVVLDSREQIVAPLVPKHRMRAVVGRLTPVVRFDGADYVVLTHAMGRVRSRDLMERHDSIASARGDLLAAVDYLFFGV